MSRKVTKQQLDGCDEDIYRELGLEEEYKQV